MEYSLSVLPLRKPSLLWDNVMGHRDNGSGELCVLL